MNSRFFEVQSGTPHEIADPSKWRRVVVCRNHIVYVEDGTWLVGDVEYPLLSIGMVSGVPVNVFNMEEIRAEFYEWLLSPDDARDPLLIEIRNLEKDNEALRVILNNANESGDRLVKLIVEAKRQGFCMDFDVNLLPK